MTLWRSEIAHGPPVPDCKYVTIRNLVDQKLKIYSIDICNIIVEELIHYQQIAVKKIQNAFLKMKLRKHKKLWRGVTWCQNNYYDPLDYFERFLKWNCFEYFFSQIRSTREVEYMCDMGSKELEDDDEDNI